MTYAKAYRLIIVCSVTILLVIIGAITPTEAKTNKAIDVDVQNTNCGYIDSGAFVTEKGDLWMWGNLQGFLGDNTKPKMIMRNVKAVVMEHAEVGVIKEDGSLWMWGKNTYGMLGDGTETKRYNPIHIMDDVKSVAIGYWHCAAVKTDGSLWTWGCNDGGPLGTGDNKDHLKPIKIMDNTKSVSASFQRTAAVKADGSLWTWGINQCGELGYGSLKSSSTPIKIMEGVRDVSMGDFACAIVKKDDSLWTCGYSYVIGDGSFEDKYSPVKIMEDVSIASIDGYRAAAIQNDGALWIWGSYNEMNNNVLSPEFVADDVKKISLSDLIAIIKTDGSAWTCAAGDESLLDTIGNMKKVYPFDISKAKVELIKRTTYSGSNSTPKPKVLLDGKQLKQGNDYSLQYTNNKNVGIAKLSITGNGDYRGMVKRSFVINPKATSITGLSSKKRKIVVKWKKQSAQTSGYQICYCAKSGFNSGAKTVTIRNSQTTKKTIKRLKRKKNYYVKIRTWKMVNNAKYYSSWSKIRSVRVK